MLDKIKEENILFIDIETVGQQPSYDLLDDHTKELWAKKMTWQSEKESKSPAELYERAGIWAEFGKIVCISAGFIVTEDGERHFRVKSFCGSNEKMILVAFSALLNKHFNKDKHMLCAHNGKEFDFPYICRRLLVNGLPIPKILDCAGKKPWEITNLDTLELWRFGDYKHYTSLDLLANIFNLPSPKENMDGCMVGRTYWDEHNIDSISEYCINDVVTICQLFLRYKGQPIIADTNVDVIPPYITDDHEDEIQ
ncbi:MAG: 3'-5' exonuclease [Salinivirgaceae bacterium]|nr:3'-5' exonuclease [Salinivirgaceae bacterium]